MTDVHLHSSLPAFCGSRQAARRFTLNPQGVTCRKCAARWNDRLAETDFMAKNEGTVWSFTALTETARNFTDTALGLESWQIVCQTPEAIRFGVDHRSARDLVRALVGEGFIVRNKYLEDAVG